MEGGGGKSEENKECKCNCIGRLLHWSSCGKRHKEKQNLKSKCEFMLRVICCCCCCYAGTKRMKRKSQVPPAAATAVTTTTGCRGSGGEEGHSDDRLNHCEYQSGDHVSRKDLACISGNHLKKNTMDELNASQLYYEPPERGHVTSERTGEGHTSSSSSGNGRHWLSDSHADTRHYMNRLVESGKSCECKEKSNSLHGDVYIGSPEKRLAQELDVIMNRSQSNGPLLTSVPILMPPSLTATHHAAAFTSSVKNIPSLTSARGGSVKLPDESFISCANERLSNGRMNGSTERDEVNGKMQVNGKTLRSTDVSERDLKRIASVDCLASRIISASEREKSEVRKYLSSPVYPHRKTSVNSNSCGVTGRRHFAQRNSDRQSSLTSSSMSRMNHMNNYYTAGEHRKHTLATLLRQRSLDQMHQQHKYRRQAKLSSMLFHDQLSRDQVCENSHENQLSFISRSESSCKDHQATEPSATEPTHCLPFDKQRQHSLEPVSDEQRSSDQTSLESEPFSPSPHLTTPSKSETVTFAY